MADRQVIEWDKDDVEALEFMKVDVLALGMREVRGLAATEAARIAAGRADQPFGSIDEIWRCSGVPPARLLELAEAYACLPSRTDPARGGCPPHRSTTV